MISMVFVKYPKVLIFIYLMNCKLVETLKSTSNNAQERTSNIFLADGVALTILLGLNTKS